MKRSRLCRAFSIKLLVWFSKFFFIRFLMKIPACFVYPYKQSSDVLRNQSVQIRVRAKTFLFIDIATQYFAHGFITMRWCVAYLNNLVMILTINPKVKIKVFFYSDSCPGYNFFVFHLSIVSPLRDTAFIHDLYITFILDLKDKIMDFLIWICISISCLAHRCMTMRRCFRTFKTFTWRRP